MVLQMKHVLGPVCQPRFRDIESPSIHERLRVCAMVKINIAYPPYGSNQLIEVDDERKW